MAENQNDDQIKPFLSKLTHEIRNPLNVILGMADALQVTQLNAEQLKYLNSLKRAGQNLLRLLNDFLDMSKIEAGQFSLESMDYSLDELLADVASATQLKGKHKGVVVECLVGPNVPGWVRGDRYRMYQVLSNLTSNSLKFTEKGKISIFVDCQEITERSVKLSLTVKDTGIGIKAENLPNMFADFKQADASITRKYGGTGLGLSICKQIVSTMGGTIEVKSIFGQGTEFVLSILFEKAKHVQEIRPQSRTVYIASSDPTHRWALESAAQLYGLDLCHDPAGGSPPDLQLVDLDSGAQSLPHIPGLVISERAINPGSLPPELTPVVIDYWLPRNFFSDFFKDHLQIRAGSAPTKITPADYSILLVDDEDEICELVSDELQEVGFNVTTASNGQIAYGLLKAQVVDLIVCDFNMPVMNGLDLLSHSRTQGIKTPFIMFSGFLTEDLKQKALPFAPVDFLQKPFRVEQIVDKINSTLSHLPIKKQAGFETSTKSKMNLLIVDDDEDNRDVMDALLKGSPCEITFATNGAEGCDAFIKTEFDLVIMDLDMPVMTGWQAIKQMRSLNSKPIPIVALSAFTEKEDTDACFEAGFTGKVNKPVNRDKLTALIREYSKAG